ncbi:MAG: sodium:proline symporter [Pseudomonadota bacterium]
MSLTFRISTSGKAIVYAGLAAGVVATLVQLILWYANMSPLPETLFRDMRLTAAIVMGTDVLPPPATFAWDVFLVSALIHFSLSIAYSVVLAYFITRFSARLSLATGILYGLFIYGINMHLFTFIFPWFAVVRDWVTILTHAVFGAVLAGTYRWLRSSSWLVQ